METWGEEEAVRLGGLDHRGDRALVVVPDTGRPYGSVDPNIPVCMIGWYPWN